MKGFTNVPDPFLDSTRYYVDSTQDLLAQCACVRLSKSYLGESSMVTTSVPVRPIGISTYAIIINALHVACLRGSWGTPHVKLKSFIAGGYFATQ